MSDQPISNRVVGFDDGLIAGQCLTVIKRMQSKSLELEKCVDLLKQSFVVDPSSVSGLRWRQVPPRHKFGDIAGGLTNQGYWRVYLNCIELRVHRIIWIIFNSGIPEGLVVDHKNGNRQDNRIENLQLSTIGKNTRARSGLNKTNQSGFLGVSKVGHKSSWTARFTRCNKRFYLGCFSNPIDAAKRFNQEAINWAKCNGEIPRYLNPV